MNAIAIVRTVFSGLRGPVVNQPGPVPTNKVMAGGLAGALVTLGVLAVQQVWPDFVLGDAAAAAVTAILSFAIAWLVRERAPAT